MKKNFPNKIADKNTKTVQNPWNFDQPEYDQRSSCYVNAGSHKGVGVRQPVGSITHNMKSAVPIGRNHEMQVDEVPRKNLHIDVDE